MKILITGSSGFLGRRAAAHFSRLGHSVLTPSHRELDIADKASVEHWFRVHQPQAVVHCAAISDTGLCQREPALSMRVNVTGSTNLAEACGQTGAKFLFCSSDQVYAGSPLPGPHEETESLSPQNTYGQHKLLAEQRCQALCANAVSLRLSWMYSSRFLPGDHGQLLTTLQAAMQDPSVPLTWPIHDRRGLTDADCVAAMLPAALNFPPGVYNFGGENDTDTYHTIRSVFSELELSSLLDRLTPNLQAFADSPRDIRMNCTRAASLGVSFEHTRDGLRRALANIL